MTVARSVALTAFSPPPPPPPALQRRQCRVRGGEGRSRETFAWSDSLGRPRRREQANEEARDAAIRDGHHSAPEGISAPASVARSQVASFQTRETQGRPSAAPAVRSRRGPTSPARTWRPSRVCHVCVYLLCLTCLTCVCVCSRSCLFTSPPVIPAYVYTRFLVGIDGHVEEKELPHPGGGTERVFIRCVFSTHSTLTVQNTIQLRSPHTLRFLGCRTESRSDPPPPLPQRF